MDKEVKDAIENSLKAFNASQTLLEGLKKDVDTMRPKMDVFDEVAYKRMVDDIGKGLEINQKLNAAMEVAAKKAEDQAKELEELKTAFNRAGAGSVNELLNDELLSKARKKALTKGFNAFARSTKGGSTERQFFDEYLAKAVESNPELKSLVTTSDPNGGYTVIPEIMGPITEFVYESSPIRQLATVTTIGTDQLELLIDNDQAAAGWVGEADARTSTTTPTFQKLIIPVNEMYANAPASQKILDDSMVDIESWLVQKISDYFGRFEATAFVTGNGVVRPKGLMSYTSGTDTTQQQVQQVVTGDASNFTYDGLVNLQAALKEEYQTNAMFLIQRASIANLMLIKDGNGQPIFNMFFAGNTGRNTGMETTILGKPIKFAADVAAIAGNALAMAYGDFKRAYQIVDRTGIRVLRDPFTSKPNVLFYCTKRVGGGVKNFEAFKIQKISA